MDLREKELFNEKISQNILKKWLNIENTIIFELEKLLYLFFCLFTKSKKYFIISFVKNILKFFYNPNYNLYSLYKKRRTMIEFTSLYNINSEKDCLMKILFIFETIDSFLAEMRENIKNIKNKNEKFKKFFHQRIFSFDITVYTLYLILKDFFKDREDRLFLTNCLRTCFVTKYDNYQKENEKLNMRDIDNEDNDYLGLDYLKFKNSNLCDEVTFYFLKIIINNCKLNILGKSF